jgi:hypothetical protein
LDINKREENEKKFSNFEELPDGSRIYWFVIEGRMGWLAKYLKTVDREETTISFRQEIFDENGILVEVHEKYPIDKGHKKIEEP